MDLLKNDYVFERDYPFVLKGLKKLNPDTIVEKKGEKIIVVVFNRKTVFNMGSIWNPHLTHDTTSFIFTYVFDSNYIIFEVANSNTNYRITSNDKIFTIEYIMNWIDREAKSEDFPQELDATNDKLRDVLDEIEDYHT